MLLEQMALGESQQFESIRQGWFELLQHWEDALQEPQQVTFTVWGVQVKFPGLHVVPMPTALIKVGGVVHVQLPCEPSTVHRAVPFEPELSESLHGAPGRPHMLVLHDGGGRGACKINEGNQFKL